MRKLGLVVTGVLLATFAFTAASAGRVSAGIEEGCAGYSPTIQPGAETPDGGNVFTGTSKRDVIVGTPYGDVINGNGGDDIICGGWGDDEIHGNSGNDWIAGEGGNDTITGDAGNDELWGDWGKSNQSQSVGCLGGCSSFDDHITGGSGKDLLVDFKGWNYLDGGSGNDHVFGKGELYGNANNDTVSASKHSFWWWYNRSNVNDLDVDEADYYSYGSYLDGGSGNDYVRGSHGDDILKGSSGNDTLRDGGGEDEFNGGSGRDDCGDVSDATSFTSCEIYWD